MAWYDNIANRARVRIGEAATVSSAVDASSVAGSSNPITVQKQQLLEQVRKSAIDKGARPTLEEYRRACVAFTTTPEGQALAENGQWKPSIYADLSGQDISNFLITEPEIKESLVSDVNLHNRDGDLAINDFYTNINFHQANIKDCIVDPATSFNDEIAKAKTIENVTFNNMTGDDKFVFGSGTYSNITMTNVKVSDQGGLYFSENTQVNGLDIRGVKAALTIGIPLDPNGPKPATTCVSNIKVDKDTSILTLTMGEGSKIQHSNLSDATIDMNSKVSGAVFQDVQFGGNLPYVDMSRAKLTNVTFNGANVSKLDLRQADLRKVSFDKVTPAQLKDLDLRGAKLEEVSINGEAVHSPKQLEKLGIKIDTHTKISLGKDMGLKKALEGVNMGWAQQQQKPIAQAPPAGAPVTAPAIDAPNVTAPDTRATTAGLQEARVGFKGNLMTADMMKVPQPETKPHTSTTPAALTEAMTNFNALKKMADSLKPEDQPRTLESSERLIAQTERARTLAQQRGSATLPPLPGRRS